MELTESTAILRDLCHRAADANLWVGEQRVPIILYSVTDYVRAIMLSRAEIAPGMPVRCIGSAEGNNGAYAFETRVRQQKDGRIDLEIPEHVVRLERRQGVRLNIELPCEVRRDGKVLRGITSNIGFGGLSIRGIDDLQVGDPLTVTVYIHGSPVPVTGIVIRIDDMGAAVAFDISGQDQIAEPLARLCFERLGR